MEGHVSPTFSIAQIVKAKQWAASAVANHQWNVISRSRSYPESGSHGAKHVSEGLSKGEWKSCDPLIKACAKGSVAEIARLLSLEQSDPQCRELGSGDHPLTAAIRHGQWSVVIFLLECDERVRAVVNLPSGDGYTPLQL
jgi:hypothetical protein